MINMEKTLTELEQEEILKALANREEELERYLTTLPKLMHFNDDRKEGQKKLSAVISAYKKLEGCEEVVIHSQY